MYTILYNIFLCEPSLSRQPTTIASMLWHGGSLHCSSTLQQAQRGAASNHPQWFGPRTELGGGGGGWRLIWGIYKRNACHMSDSIIPSTNWLVFGKRTHFYARTGARGQKENTLWMELCTKEINIRHISNGLDAVHVAQDEQKKRPIEMEHKYLPIIATNK